MELRKKVIHYSQHPMSPLTNLREYAHFDNDSIIAVWNGNSVRASFIVVTPVNQLKPTGRESEQIGRAHV